VWQWQEIQKVLRLPACVALSSATRVHTTFTPHDRTQLGKTLWAIADQLRGAVDADDFRDYMLSFLFLRYLSDNYEVAAKKELGPGYPKLETEDRRVPLAVWYEGNQSDAPDFERQMRRKVHYVIEPQHLNKTSDSGHVIKTFTRLPAFVHMECAEYCVATALILPVQRQHDYTITRTSTQDSSKYRLSSLTQSRGYANRPLSL